MIIGGGASAKAHFFLHHISRMPIVPAKLQNNAGIVGAATYAAGLRKMRV